MEINSGRIKRIYFVGIKGVAMTALAILAGETGMVVGGSDTEEDFPTAGELKKNKIKINEDFQAEHVGVFRPDLVIYTGAHGGRDNPQVIEAVRLGVPVLPHGQALGIFMSGKKQISVAGSHGKTTTAAMIATILAHAGLDPSYAIGCGEIFGLGAAGYAGHSNLFVAEADEYMTDPCYDRTPRFAWQNPEILVVINIDFDHPDAYENLAEVKSAFKEFSDTLPRGGHLVLSADDKESECLMDSKLTVTTVGLTPRSDYRISDIHFSDSRTYFRLTRNGMLIDEFLLQVPGRHNVVNAAMAAVTGNIVGLTWPVIREGLAGFRGTKRRFEKLGEARGVTFYDDYAHHPNEIAATLAAARGWYPGRRLAAVFQPHTYSRTKALLNDFAQSFKNADLVILTDIYASAREKETLGVTGKTLAEATLKYHRRVIYAESPDKILEILKNNCRSDDVVIFMGAGDIYRWGREIVYQFKMTDGK